MSLTQLNAAELARSLRAREVSAREVVDAYLARIESEDSQYKAFLTVDADGARKLADEAQAKLDSGHGGPLTGVPVALKDNISTNGLRTTCASKILDTYVPPFDAHVVDRLRAAGCPVLGKTNLDEFAMGASCENSAYYPSHNPWDTDLVPGGSSGGSAAAVSAELAPISLGSDTGGSIRQPASLCGIVGFKPTYGRISRYGLVAFGSSLDQIGPMGKNVEDTALLAEAISGHDPMDSTSLPTTPINTRDLKEGTVKGKRFALPKELFTDEIDPGVRECVELSVETLTKEGAVFTEVSLPSIAFGVTTYYIIAPAEASSNLARFDGIRFGPRLEGEGHIGNVAETRGKLFGPEVKLRIMVGTYALSAGYYDAFYLRAQQVRALMAEEFEKAFQDFDAVLSPTSPIVAFPIGGLVDDPMKLKLIDFCTIPANMGGFPSISVPCGLSQDLPVGMLLTGPVMGDEALLQTAYGVERALGRDYRRPPIL